MVSRKVVPILRVNMSGYLSLIREQSLNIMRMWINRLHKMLEFVNFY